MLVKSLIVAAVSVLAVLLVISSVSVALLGALHAAAIAAVDAGPATASPPTGGPEPGNDAAAPPGPDNPAPSRDAVTDIPAAYLRLYQQASAGTCPGLSWTVLAAIGRIESDHGRSTLPGVHSGGNAAAGAQGPMQFLPATFAEYDHPTPPGGADPPSPFDPVDAIYAAARLLCASGAGNHRDLPAAIFAYNHASWYVREVLTQAARYSETTPNTSATCGSFQRSLQSGGEGFSSAVVVAVRFACAQLGRPYLWGGNGTGGFDCSGLTKAAYAAAGIAIPRTADQQFRAGPRLAPEEPLRPGDLVFYGDTNTRITHVALYIGANQVVQARDVGTLIEQDTLPRAGYAGATRPAAQNAGPR